MEFNGRLFEIVFVLIIMLNISLGVMTTLSYTSPQSDYFSENYNFEYNDTMQNVYLDGIQVQTDNFNTDLVLFTDNSQYVKDMEKKYNLGNTIDQDGNINFISLAGNMGIIMSLMVSTAIAILIGILFFYYILILLPLFVVLTVFTNVPVIVSLLSLLFNMLFIALTFNAQSFSTDIIIVNDSSMVLLTTFLDALKVVTVLAYVYVLYMLRDFIGISVLDNLSSMGERMSEVVRGYINLFVYPLTFILDILGKIKDLIPFV